MPFYTYVPVSKEFDRYTGHTSDLELRISRRHLKTTHFTKKGTHWRPIYSRESATRSEAMKHEKWLKTGVGKQWLKANIAGWSPPKAQ